MFSGAPVAAQPNIPTSQEEDAFAKANGCLPVKSRLQNKLPLGLDVLKKQYDALPSQKLLAFQSQFFNKLDATFSIHLFGGTGYTTTDPRNVEALTVTRFQGKHGCSDHLISNANNGGRL